MSHAVTTIDLPEQFVVAIRERHAPADIPSFLGAAFADLFGRLGLMGGRPARRSSRITSSGLSRSTPRSASRSTGSWGRPDVFGRTPFRR